MFKHEDSRDAFIDSLRATLPPKATEDAQSRVQNRVLAAMHTRKNPRPQRLRRITLGLSVALAVGVLTFASLAPRMETLAFARERATSALMFQVSGKVLHLEIDYTQQDLATPENDTDQRWSIWADVDGKQVREQFVDNKDGSLDVLHIRTRERDILFNSHALGEARLIESNTGIQPIGTVLDDWIPWMRAQIASGNAKVTGTEVIEGEKYWIVACGSDDGNIKERVTLRKSDYRLKTWRTDVTYDSKDSKGTVTKIGTIKVIEQLDPKDLPENFFALDVVRDAAK